jgi:ribosome biogenesis GTPase
MQREAQHFQTSVADKRRKDKAFGKMYKQVVKQRKNNKY